MQESFVNRQLSRATELINRVVPWHKLPLWLGLANLAELRTTLRAENLHDTTHVGEVPKSEAAAHGGNGNGNGSAVAGVAPSAPPPLPPASSDLLALRTADGSYNDLENPRMGMRGMRFGRNVPLPSLETPSLERILTPNPREISERLLARKVFTPATSLNLLAASWIQFITRDWFSHGVNEPTQPYEIPLRADDPWHEHPMHIPRTMPDPTRCPVMKGQAVQGPPTFVNAVTHWWDASHIYGSDEATMRSVRAGRDGKLKVINARLPGDPQTGFDLIGFQTDTTWTGVSLLHTLFALEHNAICDALLAANPSWNDEQVFGRARLINAALLAKIHTVEWTPALLSHPTTTAAMHAQWWGLASERVSKLFGRLNDDEILSGIPGSPKNHHGVPYSITEEFVSVYRMHSLIPDEIVCRSLRDNTVIRASHLQEFLNADARRMIDDVGMENLLYSFGIAHPGALRLHNYPQGLRQLKRLDGSIIDLAATEILRDRERAVPRYNEFRRRLHMPAPASFEEMTDNPTWAKELREIYGDVENVDLMVGCLVEPLPPGLAFSDTAFRVFILMASRRLKSDRFFTTDYTPEVYTQLGLDWVQNNSMSSVLIRHYPALASALLHVKNAFGPWNQVSVN